MYIGEIYILLKNYMKYIFSLNRMFPTNLNLLISKSKNIFFCKKLVSPKNQVLLYGGGGGWKFADISA